jgi:hypothetical protein
MPMLDPVIPATRSESRIPSPLLRALAGISPGPPPRPARESIAALAGAETPGVGRRRRIPNRAVEENLVNDS